MSQIIESFEFYRWQILHAGILGCLMATIGILVVLRSQASYGLLAAQASVSAGILNTWLWGVGGLALWALPFSLLFSWPFYVYSRRSTNSEAVLLGGMLIYVGLGEVMAALGHFRMHLIQSYFGDVLTTGTEELWISLVVGLLLVICLYYYFDRLLLFSIDPQYARVIGMPIKRLDSVLYILLTVPLAWSIQQIGMFVSMGHMILPGLAVLGISRSPLRAIVYACLISIAANLGAFALSFIEWSTDSEKLTLPTSSLILVLLGILSITLLAWQYRPKGVSAR